MKDHKKSNPEKKSPPWRKVILAMGWGVGLVLFVRQIILSCQALHQQKDIYFEPIFLLGGLILSILVYFLQMLAWIMIMRFLGISFSLLQSLQGFFLSFLPRYIPGGVWGYLSRSQWLERSYNIEYSISGLGSILESLALILTAFIVVGAYFCIHSSGYIQFLLFLGCVVLFILTWLFVPGLVMRATQRFSDRKISSRFEGAFSFRSWVLALMFYLALWLCYGGAVLLAGNAVKSPSSNDLLTATFASAISWVLGFIAAFVPAGIGIREFTLSTLLSLQPLHLNYLHWQADLIAVISRLTILLAELCWLSVGLGLRVHQCWQSLLQRDSICQSEGE